MRDFRLEAGDDVVAFELAAPLLFAVRRLRPVGYVMGIGMFAMIAVTMRELVFFALQMCAFFVLFVDEDRLWRLRRRISAWREAGADP